MSGALEGLKVIDLSRVLGGPYCGQMLADHGAEVVLVSCELADRRRLPAAVARAAMPGASASP